MAEPTETAATAVVAQPEDDGPRPYQLLWTKKVGGWTHDVVITPAGDPLFLNSFQLTLLARHDGSELQRAKLTCSAPNDAMAVIDDETVVLGCDEGIVEVQLPNLAFRRVLKLDRMDFDAKPEAFTAHGDLAAYATRTGKVVVLRREPPTYVRLFEIDTGAEVESMVITPNHAWLVVGEGAKSSDEGGTLVVYDLKTGKELRRSNVQGRSRVTALSASPESNQVFAHVGSFEASVWNLDTTAWGSAFKIGSWLSSSTWLSPTLVFGSGSDGAALFPLDRGHTVELEIPDTRMSAMAGAGATPDGSYFCSGDRGGIVACWSNQPVEASTYEPPPPLTR